MFICIPLYEEYLPVHTYHEGRYVRVSVCLCIKRHTGTGMVCMYICVKSGKGASIPCIHMYVHHLTSSPSTLHVSFYFFFFFLLFFLAFSALDASFPSLPVLGLDVSIPPDDKSTEESDAVVAVVASHSLMSPSPSFLANWLPRFRSMTTWMLFLP
jgi:hypothetical protein